MSGEFLKGLNLRDLLARAGVAREKEQLDISITPSVAETLKRLMQRPNPQLAEFAFLGLGLHDPRVIDGIVACEGGYSANSGLLQDDFLGVAVDPQELQLLFNQVFAEGCLDKVQLLGHYQPSGACTIGGVKYIVRPDDSLLNPSAGVTGFLTNTGDISFYRSFLALNPRFANINTGIAAFTPQGPKLRLYRAKDLVTLKRYRDYEKIPVATIVL